MLPGWLLTTRDGWQAGDAEVLKPAQGTSSGGDSSSSDVPADAGWLRVLDDAVAEVRAGLRTIASSAVPLPEVGYEGADERGRVFAEAELAWPDQKLVVLTSTQDDQAAGWRSKEWAVLLSSTEGWADEVLAALKKEIQG
jgi:DEAD/DEAH box helicase domain-containing protein